MANNYDIGSLLGLAFDLRVGIGWNIPSPPSANQLQNWIGANQYKPEMKEENKAETRKSWMGTEILFPITLKGGNKLKVYRENGEIEIVRYGDFDMPGVTLVDFSQDKIVSKTNVLGGNGSVKEMFSFDDWKIRIRGLCLDEPGVRTALQQKEALLFFNRIIGAIDVVGDGFTEKKIYSIVINSITFRQIEGKPWVIPFEMEAESDEPLELVL